MTQGTLFTIWKGMGFWKWPAVLMLLIWAGLTPYLGPIPPQWQNHGPQTAGGVTLTLETRGRMIPGNDVELRLTANDTRTRKISAGFDISAFQAADSEQRNDGMQTKLTATVPDGPLAITARVPGERGDRTFRWHLGKPTPE